MPLPPAGVHVTYRQQFVRCSKPACTVCAPGKPGHGPYWYGYWRDNGRKRSAYFGKERPAAATAAAPNVPSGPPPAAFGRPLPSVPTSLVGRERDISEIAQIVARPGRPVTLTGPGGCGKSRLALAVAAAVTDAFPDGVAYVDLGPLADPALLEPAVAAALGIAERPGQPWSATLASALGRRRALLLLDHCTHLLAPCTEMISALGRRCPGLRILATSQEALGLPGEIVRSVPSLALPALGVVASPDRLAQVPAVRLFLERGLLARSGFALTTANAAPLAQVCRRLDGIPLALELAAAELATMPVEGVLALLRERFAHLAGAVGAAVSRQETVRTALECAHDQLDPAARRVVRRLSVFAGTFDAAAATAVCADGLLAPEAVPALLERLLRAALVQVVRQEETDRYRLPDNVRGFARERLDPGEAEATRARHLAHYRDLAERVAAARTGPHQGGALDRLAGEIDNLRAALGWSLPGTDGDTARLCLATALRWLWDVRGAAGEGRRWLERLLAECQDAAPAVRARALAAAGDLAMRQADYSKAEALLQESLALCRALGEQADSAVALTALGNVATYGHDLDRAHALHLEALAIRRSLGDPRLIAGALDNLGEVAQQRGDLAEAEALYAEALDLARSVGDNLRVGSVLNGMGFVAFLRGDFREAAARFRESLALQRALDDRYGMIFNLEDLALVAAAAGQAVRSAQLFGAVESLRAATEVPLQPTFAQHHDSALARLRADLAEEALAQAWAAGRAMALEGVLDFALV